ncbi:MAG: site-2 protease family protein [Planctomycetes bacterium]|nr:site-2 protease family protein [Planctomycetota bacterium]
MTAYRDHDHSPLLQLLRLATRSFAVGTIFGVHVRMYWAAAILTPLLAWRWMPGGGAFAFTLSLVVSALLFVVVWSHEVGHIAAGWRHRIRTDLITLSPLGGLAHMNAPAATPRGELQIALAGPAVHLAWLLVFWPLRLLLPEWYTATGAMAQGALLAIWYLVAINQTLLVFNLIPFFPLDGGRCLRALLAMRVHPNRATMWATSVGIAGGALLVLLALAEQELSSFVLLLIGLSCISQSLQERRLARHALVYQHTVVDPWAADPDAWRRGGEAQGRRRPGWLARWRQARAERRAAQRAAAQQAFDREVDRILDRVHQVGMSGLDAREREVLKRASRRRRGAG